MFRILVAVVALIAVVITPAVAQIEDVAGPLVGAPSLLGPTGAVVTPTTTVDDETVSFGYSWLNDTFDGVFKLNVSPIEKLEIGVTHYEGSSMGFGLVQGVGALVMTPGDDDTIFHGKYRVLDEEENRPAVTVGVWDVTDERDILWYGVVGKTFGDDVPVTINLGGATGDVVLDGFFANVNIELHEDVAFVGEYDSENVNFGFRARPMEGLTLEILGVDNGTGHHVGLGASYGTDF